MPTQNTLQQQADSAFQNAEPQDIHGQAAALMNSATVTAAQTIQFADEEDDAVPFTPLVDDGKGPLQPFTNFEYADDETAQPATSVIPPASIQSAQTRQQRPDLHQPDGNTGKGDFDPGLLARARQYGLDDQKIAEQYRTPEALETALLDIDQQAINRFTAWKEAQAYQAQMERWQRQLAPPPQAPMPVAAPLPQTPPAFQNLSPEQQRAADAQAALEAYKLKQPEIYEEELANDLTGLASHTATQLNQQRQEMERLRQLVEQQQQTLQQFQQRQQQEAMNNEQFTFDNQIRNLGNGWDEVLGVEDARVMDKSSPEYRNRLKVWETAKQLQMFHAANGRSMPIESVLPTSLQISFPQRNAVATRSTPSRDAQGRFLARPTRRSGGQVVDKYEQTLQMWDQFAQDRGLSGAQGRENGITDI